MLGQSQVQSNQRQVLGRQEETLDVTHALQKDMVVTLEAVDRNHSSVTAALNMLIAAQDPTVPWLFTVVPDARGKRLLTSPKKWGKN